jgi:hypothetical protein
MPSASHIHTVSIWKIAWLLLSNPCLWRPLAEYLGTVLRDFFYPQFQTRLFPRIRPVVAVDHPLDRYIPFTPTYVGVYLSFVHTWVKALQFVHTHYGTPAVPDIRDFLHDLTRMYQEAGRVYRQCQSTTARPGVRLDSRFVLIHAADPHLNCVPSLHVMVVCYTYYQVQRMLRRHGCPADDTAQQVRLFYQEALLITESILFIKQHSVNCIPAALYMLTYLFADFTDTDVTRFINDLFVAAPIEAAASQQIRAYIGQVYADLHAQTPQQGDFRQVVVEFIRAYDQNALKV